MYRMLVLVLLVTFGLPAFAAAAPIYRCAGAGGATVFSQVPCGSDSAQMAPSGAKKAPSMPGADASGDKAALAEIDSRCDAQSHRVLDGYSARFADANAAIAELHKHLMVPGDAGVQKDPAVQKKIAALEAQKTDLLDAQDHELSTLRNQCQTERDAQLKRQTDRDATHAVVKR